MSLITNDKHRTYNSGKCFTRCFGQFVHRIDVLRDKGTTIPTQ